MREAPHHDLSRRERQIVDILYTQGRATAAEVQAALPDPPSYSAVRAMLRILEDKGPRPARAGRAALRLSADGGARPGQEDGAAPRASDLFQRVGGTGDVRAARRIRYPAFRSRARPAGQAHRSRAPHRSVIMTITEICLSPGCRWPTPSRRPPSSCSPPRPPRWCCGGVRGAAASGLDARAVAARCSCRSLSFALPKWQLPLFTIGAAAGCRAHGSPRPTARRTGGRRFARRPRRRWRHAACDRAHGAGRGCDAPAARSRVLARRHDVADGCSSRCGCWARP